MPVVFRKPSTRNIATMLFTPPMFCTSACLLMFALQSVSGHAIDAVDRRNQAKDGAGTDRKPLAESKALDMESIFAGFAKSMISRTGPTSSQMLSLNLSNVVLMLVLKGLIWGASYMQGGGVGKEGRMDDDGSSAANGWLLQDAFTETDVLLFLGYLVADESGHFDCLNRVACEQPSRADGYLKSAEMVWKTVKMFDGWIPMDAKYEDMLIRLQEAIEDGRADGDCQAKYKCSESTVAQDKHNSI